MTDILDNQKVRIVQELVPGREITLAHLIANPDKSLYASFDEIKDKQQLQAIGIMSVSPAETSIIMADIAIKASGVSIVGGVSHTSGSLVIAGSVSEVDEALRAVLMYCRDILRYSVCDMTKT